MAWAPSPRGSSISSARRPPASSLPLHLNNSGRHWEMPPFSGDSRFDYTCAYSCNLLHLGLDKSIALTPHTSISPAAPFADTEQPTADSGQRDTLQRETPYKGTLMTGGASATTVRAVGGAWAPCLRTTSGHVPSSSAAPPLLLTNSGSSSHREFL